MHLLLKKWTLLLQEIGMGSQRRHGVGLYMEDRNWEILTSWCIEQMRFVFASIEDTLGLLILRLKHKWHVIGRVIETLFRVESL